jgi:chromosome segregation ATPase
MSYVGNRRLIAAQAVNTFAQSDESEERIRASLEKSMLTENSRLTARIESLTADLTKANTTIFELQARDQKREAEMIQLQSDFDRDKLLRANIEVALAAANDKISALTTRLNESQQRISALEDEVNKRDARIKELEQNSAQASGFGVR